MGKKSIVFYSTHFVVRTDGVEQGVFGVFVVEMIESVLGLVIPISRASRQRQRIFLRPTFGCTQKRFGRQEKAFRSRDAFEDFGDCDGPDLSRFEWQSLVRFFSSNAANA